MVSLFEAQSSSDISSSQHRLWLGSKCFPSSALPRHSFTLCLICKIKAPSTRAPGRAHLLSLTHLLARKTSGHEPATRVWMWWVGRPREGLTRLKAKNPSRAVPVGDESCTRADGNLRERSFGLCVISGLWTYHAVNELFSFFLFFFSFFKICNSSSVILRRARGESKQVSLNIGSL